MTEINDGQVNPWALLLALVAGPILASIGATILMFPFGFAAMIPIYAIMLGGPFYLVIGFPVALWGLHRFPALPLPLLALLTNIALCIAAMLLFILLGWRTQREMAQFYLAFGSLFAPLWGFATSAIYRRFQPTRPCKDAMS